jgi:hypothetical protein
MTKFEEIADLFVKGYVKDHPINFHSLDNELNEFLEGIQELKNPSTVNEIQQEYEKSNTKKIVDEKLTQEAIASGQRALENFKEQENESEKQHNGNMVPGKPSEILDYSSTYQKPMNSAMLEYLQSPSEGNSLVHNLKQLIIMDDNVIVRNLHELVEADQDDYFMPNDWIYHRDSDINDILNYVRNYYDKLRKEDENEPYEFFPNFDDYK